LRPHKTRSQYVLTSQIGTTRSTTSSRKDSDMPAVYYYTVSRRQEVVVSTAYGEVVALEAGIAAMDEDMPKLEALAAGEGNPERHVGPRATVKEVRTISADVELR
jgi:hypothetical protein